MPPLKTVRMAACPLYVPDKEGHVYTQKNILPLLNNIHSNIANRTLFGEFQPSDDTISLSNVSHLIKRVWFESYNLMCEFDVLDTQVGKILHGLMKHGIELICRPRFIKSNTGVIQGIITFDIYLKNEDIFDITSIKTLRKLKLEKIMKKG